MCTIRRIRTGSLLALTLTLGSLAACSDDKGGGAATTAPAATQVAVSTTSAGSAPGTITVSATTITGQNGKALLVFATSATQQGQLGVACIMITSDSFDVPSIALAEVPTDNPCAGGTPAVAFADGSYTISAGIYTPGSQTAEATATLTVDIVDQGVGSVQFTGSALSA